MASWFYELPSGVMQRDESVGVALASHMPFHRSVGTRGRKVGVTEKHQRCPRTRALPASQDSGPLELHVIC